MLNAQTPARRKRLFFVTMEGVVTSVTPGRQWFRKLVRLSFITSTVAMARGRFRVRLSSDAPLLIGIAAPWRLSHLRTIGGYGKAAVFVEQTISAVIVCNE